KGSVFAGRMDAPSGQTLKVVSPVGYAADRRRWLERVTRAVARSSSRKDFDQLFAYGEPGTPIDAGSKWYAPLMLMRQAPSSTNSQPWRAVVTAGGVDFYHTGKSRLALIDMGIGLCHFHIGCEAAEITGNFVCDSDRAKEFSGLTYLCSFSSEE
ncbi:MAG: hypothetical protein K2M76_05520, partial [Muribaculaceae bacterium]|nr:hypothetical protein [Muribaculaceae bacterium]